MDAGQGPRKAGRGGAEGRSGGIGASGRAAERGTGRVAPDGVKPA
jgi:hypothetical protein